MQTMWHLISWFTLSGHRVNVMTNYHERSTRRIAFLFRELLRDWLSEITSWGVPRKKKKKRVSWLSLYLVMELWTWSSSPSFICNFPSLFNGLPVWTCCGGMSSDPISLSLCCARAHSRGQSFLGPPRPNLVKKPFGCIVIRASSFFLNVFTCPRCVTRFDDIQLGNFFFLLLLLMYKRHLVGWKWW